MLEAFVKELNAVGWDSKPYISWGKIGFPNPGNGRRAEKILSAL